jgi:NCS2 family nucleobase:cation symporter-2/xanthine permease XanP
MLALLGLFPAVGHWVTAMPPAVLGGMALLLFGLVSVSGLRLIVAGHLSHRDGLIVALALGVGLGAPSQTEWLSHMPAFFRGLLDSGVSAGGITAIVLNLLLPGGKRLVDER